MTTKTVTITKDGTLTVVKSDEDGPPVPPPPGQTRSHDGFNVGIHSSKPFDGASFVVGLIVGMLVLLFFQRRARSRRHRPVDVARRDGADQARMAENVAALARRTATLETIVTDPAQRTAREIDALR